MGDIKICSFNCRGLGAFEKRRDVLNYLRQSSFNIIMLQDIHCAPESENLFRSTWGGDVKIVGFSSNSRGVAILSKTVGLKYIDTHIDSLGNYIIASVVINDIFEAILVNTYGPNTDDPLFFANIWRICSEMRGVKDTPVMRERERETIYFRIGHKHVLGHTRIGVKAPGALNTGRRSFGLHHQFLETKLCHLVSITSSKTTSKEKRKKNNIHHTQYTSTFAICRSFSS